MNVRNQALRPTSTVHFDNTDDQPDTFGLANLFSGTACTHTVLLDANIEYSPRIWNGNSWCLLAYHAPTTGPDIPQSYQKL